MTSSSSITTGSGYDAAGNQTAVTGGNGNATWTTYNAGTCRNRSLSAATAAPGAAARTWTTS